jgi:hypothetical protein
MYKKMKQHLVNRLSQKEYVELEHDLTLYPFNRENILDFLSKEGPSLLNWAIVSSEDPGPLDYLYRLIPALDLKTALTSQNGFILQGFFGTEVSMEKAGLYNHDAQMVRIAKLKIMLLIDKEGMEQFIAGNSSEYLSTPSLQEAFSEAKKAIIPHVSI